MPQFIPVLAICMIAGIAFLVLSMTALARLPAALNASGEMTICWNGISLKSSNVCMGVAIISALFGLVLPIIVLVETAKGGDPAVQLAVTLHNLPAKPQIDVTHSGGFTAHDSPIMLTVFKSVQPQSYKLATSQTGGVQIDSCYDPQTKKLAVTVRSDNAPIWRRSFSVENGVASVDVELPAATIAAVRMIPPKHAPPPSVAQNVAVIPDPVVMGAQR
jgi:hypothetical protein